MSKHVPIIGAFTAKCACGNMPVMVKPESETRGKFTLRAHAVWELHAAMDEPRWTLFDQAPEHRTTPVTTAQPSLF